MGRGLEDTLRFGPGGVAASDPIPTSADQFLVVGAEEGIYTLNLHELHEDTLEKVRPLVFWGHKGTGVLGADHLCTVWPQLISQRCSWLYCVNNVLLSLSGRRRREQRQPAHPPPNFL